MVLWDHCLSSFNWRTFRGVHLSHVRGSSIGTLSKDVFERRTSTGSEAFSLFIYLDANKLVLLSFFSLFKAIYPRVSTKPLPSDAKSPLSVDVRRSKTLLLKLPNIYATTSLKEKRILYLIFARSRQERAPRNLPDVTSSYPDASQSQRKFARNGRWEG